MELSKRFNLVFAALVTSGIMCACDDDHKTDHTHDAAVEGDAAPAPRSSTSTKANAASSTATEGDPLHVKIESGELEGELIDDGQVRSFLGIPYAKPPVGELRWKAPQKPASWTAVREAKSYGNRCPQPASAVLQNAASDTEDCLYLNVWAPAAASKQKRPVMFWIHGGGNVNGSTSEPVPFVNSAYFYSGEHLAQRDVVVVSINYRLGVLGFLAHPALHDEGETSGNQGLWDQQFALEWVKRNIERFGGDPDHVTIFGESAGSFDVCMHVASPKSRGLFQRAISESGGCTTYQVTKATAEQRALTLATKLGCDDSNTLTCLRGKSVQELLDASVSGSSTSSQFNPIVDGDFMPDQPRALYDSGNIAKVPYILGSNTDEGTLFTTSLSSVNGEAAFRATIMQSSAAPVDEVVAHYPPSQFTDASNPYQAALARVFGDSALVCSTYDVALRAAKAGSSIYLYNFDIPANAGGLGATHGSELVYVFGTSPSLSAEQQTARDRIQRYWTNLAKTGDPNGDDLLGWPKFSGEADTRLNFALEFALVEKFRSAECEFWRGVYDARFAAEQ